MTRALTAMLISLLLPQGAAAQAASGQAPSGQPAAGAPGAAELAKQTQNPIASLISFPLEANWDMGVGDREATSTLLNIQPVVPFGISKSTNVVLRVIMPLTSQPSSATDGRRNSGLGDVLMSAFFTAAKSGRVMWGVGPVLLLPTATNGALGGEKFGIGPTAVVPSIKRRRTPRAGRACVHAPYKDVSSTGSFRTTATVKGPQEGHRHAATAVIDRSR